MRKDHLLYMLAKYYQDDNVDHKSICDFLQTYASDDSEFSFNDFEIFLMRNNFFNFLTAEERCYLQELYLEEFNDYHCFNYYIFRNCMSTLLKNLPENPQIFSPIQLPMDHSDEQKSVLIPETVVPQINLPTQLTKHQLDEQVQNFKKCLRGKRYLTAKAMWDSNSILQAYFSGQQVNLKDGLIQIDMKECLYNFKVALTSRSSFVIKSMWNANLALRGYFYGIEGDQINISKYFENFEVVLTSRCSFLINAMWKKKWQRVISTYCIASN